MVGWAVVGGLRERILMMNNEIKAKIDRLEAQELRFALVLHALAYLYSKVGKRQNPARHRFDKMTDGSTLDGLVSDFIERNRPENLKQSTQAITDEVFDRANSDNQERVMYATGMHNTAVGIINLYRQALGLDADDNGFYLGKD